LGGNRTRTKIKFRILQLLSESPADKNRVKYEAGLSSKQMMYYMPDLIKDQFVEHIQHSGVYRIREKGKKIIGNG
jgi:predicted transcriptional regulator